jgi:hypothetical protein
MPPHSPTVRQLLAAQYAEARRLDMRHGTRRARRRIVFPRPLAALRARRADVGCATC